MPPSGFAPVLDAARGIVWPARHRVRSAVPGPHLSSVRGTADEVVEYRLYRQGDDPRTIDWKLVARTDRVYTRVSQERAILPTMLVLDASASMAFPPPANAKWHLACQVAIGLAAIARHGGDPVGLSIVHAAGIRTVEPRSRTTVLEEMMRAVEVTPSGSAPLAPAVREAMRRAARVVLLTDFLDDADALLPLARTYVAGGGELMALHVVDAGELDPDPRRLLLEDPERPLMKRPMPAAAREAYRQRFSAWREQLARAWRAAGVPYSMLVPGAERLRQSLRRITVLGAEGGAPR